MGVQSATQGKKRYRCTPLVHCSYWVSPHENSHWLRRHRTQGALKDRSLILLYLLPCSFKLPCSSWEFNMSSESSSASPRGRMCRESGFPSVFLSVRLLRRVHLLKSLKSLVFEIELLSHQLICLVLILFVFFNSKHPSKLMCYWNTIYPKFF